MRYQCFWKHEELEGTFGDRKVLLSLLPPPRAMAPEAPLVMFLHGVHGCATMEEGNKYRALGEMLLSRNIASCLVESSRLRRDRAAFGTDYPSWALEAFAGKTYRQDLADFARAAAYLQKEFPSRPLWLWGFSLGGIHSVLLGSSLCERTLAREELAMPPLLPGKFAGIVLAGSGHNIRRSQQKLLQAPVLSTLPLETVLLEASRHLECAALYAFYGSRDDTFTERSCRELFEGAPEERRGFFQVIKGADHAFRQKDGHPSLAPLEEMATLLEPVFLS